MKKSILSLAILVITSLNAQNFDWVKSMGGSLNDEAYYLTTDDNGNVYTSGAFMENVDFDPNAGVFNLISQGQDDIFIQKLDAQGNLVWAKSVGGVQNDVAFGIAVDALENVYITGYFNDTVDFDPGPGTTNVTSQGAYDIFLLKLDSNGNFLWVKTIGGNSYDIAYSIKLDTSSNIYLTGIYKETVDFDPGAGTFSLTSAGDYDSFVLKLDASGNFIWAKSSGGNALDYGRYLTVDLAENVYIAGYLEGTADLDPGSGVANFTSHGAGDMYIQKLDISGNLVWAKSLGGNLYDYAHSITIDDSGNLYISGDFSATVDFDPGTGVANQTSVGSFDIFILKLDNSGNFVWVKSMGSILEDSAYKIVLDDAGNIYTSGYFAETVDFDPNTGTTNLTSVGEYDIFILKLDNLGRLIWAKSMGGLGNDTSYALDIDASNNVYTSGFYEGTVDFDPGAGTSNYTSVGFFDFFVHKMNQQNVGVDSIDKSLLRVYPTPTTNGKISISGNNIKKIEITDINGKIIKQLKTFENLTTIDLSEQTKGIYFVKITTKTEVVIKKIVLDN